MNNERVERAGRLLCRIVGSTLCLTGIGWVMVGQRGRGAFDAVAGALLFIAGAHVSRALKLLE